MECSHDHYRFILLMSHATKLLQTLFLKHNYNLKKEEQTSFQDLIQILKPCKDRDLKLQARGKCTSLSLDLLNKQLSTISINITVIISFCMVYKCLCNPKFKQDKLHCQWCRKRRKLMMWQCDNHRDTFFLFLRPILCISFRFLKRFQTKTIVMCH